MEDDWTIIKNRIPDRDDIALRDVCSVLRCRMKHAREVMAYAMEKGYVSAFDTNKGIRYVIKCPRKELLKKRWVNNDAIYCLKYKDPDRAQTWSWRNE